MYKNNSRDSSKFKGCSPLQLSRNLTGKHHAFGYYSYTHRCSTLEQTVQAQLNQVN
ncbi:hypothetical protein EV201_0296 [Ancylomarina subtilis]|uniref:Uncharacterized protein n=1 Tax=Ancylomarina subtilis TaxID=1639035 RepID=A0A4Q7VHT9_9BACT|nr:hypothetical protein EV201_0296 [Ancylomarina subtilis]